MVILNDFQGQITKIDSSTWMGIYCGNQTFKVVILHQLVMVIEPPASHMVIFPWDRGTSTRPGKLLQFAMENHHAMKMGNSLFNYGHFQVRKL